MISPRLSALRRGMIQRQIAGNFNDDSLDGNALCQHQTVQAIHRLRENGFLVDGISRNNRPQDSSESLKDSQSLRWGSRLADKSFECQAKKDKEERDGFITIIDFMTFPFRLSVGRFFAVSLFFTRLRGLRSSIQRIKDKIYVFFDKTSNCINEI